MERCSSRILIAGAFVSGLLAAALPVSADAGAPIACGTILTVARGDTLDGIAARAYDGRGFRSDVIFKANSDFLRDARRLEIGDRLLVPCLDGTGPQDRVAALEAETVAGIALQLDEPVGAVAPADSVADSRADFLADTLVDTLAESLWEPTAVSPGDGTGDAKSIHLVTSPGFAPFTDAGLEAGGMLTDLLRRAITAVDANFPPSVDFVDNRSAHLDRLLPQGNHDVSFPWVKPDCVNPDALDPESRRRCKTLSFSRPLVEVTVGFYARVGSPLIAAADATALAGTRVCRSEAGWLPDLTPGSDGSQPQTAATAEECFDRLRRGETDVVSLVREQAETTIYRIGFGEAVAEIPGLRATRALHAVALKGNEVGEEALSRIDLGIERIMLSGNWFEVVAAHRSQFAALR